MNTKELRETVQEKNEIIMQQAKRIELLEEKIAELRRKYFRVKYAGKHYELPNDKKYTA